MEWTSLFNGPKISTSISLERKIMRTIINMIARLLKQVKCNFLGTIWFLFHEKQLCFCRINSHTGDIGWKGLALISPRLGLKAIHLAKLIVITE